PRAPAAERIERLAEVVARRGELVDVGRRGRGQPSLLAHPGWLEVLQPGGQDVRTDSGQCRGQVGVALLAAEQLPDDEERPALADELERVSHRAVLRIALRHGGNYSLFLAFWKLWLAKCK